MQKPAQEFPPPYPSADRVANCKDFTIFSGNEEISGARRETA
jgi:hypothetical protein